jgi:hypothetical protein
VRAVTHEDDVRRAEDEFLAATRRCTHAATICYECGGRLIRDMRAEGSWLPDEYEAEMQELKRRLQQAEAEVARHKAEMERFIAWLGQRLAVGAPS